MKTSAGTREKKQAGKIGWFILVFSYGEISKWTKPANKARTGR